MFPFPFPFFGTWNYVCSLYLQNHRKVNVVIGLIPKLDLFLIINEICGITEITEPAVINDPRIIQAASDIGKNEE